MKREKKAERDTALWLNDDQESLLVEHKRRIKRREDHRRAEQERWREDKRRAEQERRQEEQRRVKEADTPAQAVARADVADSDYCQVCGEPISYRRRIDVGIHRRARYCSPKCVGAAIKARTEKKERKRRHRAAAGVLRQAAIKARAEKERKQREELQRAEQERRWQEQLKERKRREEQQRERHRLSDLSEKVMNPKISACFPLPELDEDDIQLAEKWYPSQEKLDERSLIDVINDDPKDWDSGRLLSARSAEKIAICFYRHYGKKVRDISITQLDENNNSDWRDYDLNVDGCHIDAKNSRQSQKSKDRYTEYCIPRFKTERRTNQEVRIAGVFSPYLWAFELLDEPVEHHQDREIQFLGETTLEKQEALKREFNGDLVYFSEPRSSSRYFLPPWIFDYPKYIYTERDKARKELKGFSNLSLLKEATTKHNLIPVAIAAGMDLTKILDKEALGCWEWSFLEQLNNRIEKYGLSLPFLFLTILSHFLGMASSPKTVSDFNPGNYRKFLFYKGRSNNPLGIYDPLKTIDALIGNLNNLWIAEGRPISRFRAFKLMSFNILQGKHDRNEDTWTTLIAYCGGKLENRSSCGKNPLVLGESELCECRRLICPDCGFCCEDEWACGCKRGRR